MTVINIVNGSMGIVNDDVLFWDDDKEVILVELWAQMKQQVKNIRTKVKEAKLIGVYSNFGQTAPREPKFLSPLYPDSCPNMLLPSCLTSSPSSQNKQNNK